MFDGLRSMHRGRGAGIARRHRGSRVVLALALAAGSALATTALDSAASASGMWSAPTLVDSGGGLTSVSCPTVKFCVAVDGTGNAVIHKRNNTWEAPNPIDAGDGGLSSVSCATTLFCMAVDGVGNEKRYAYGTWFRAVSIDPGVALDAVSCAKNTFCAAVDADGNALTYDGTAWTSPTIVDGGNAVVGISCPTVTFCAAIDDSTNALTFDGTGWTSPASIDSGSTLESVSCATATLCVAVDDHGNALTFDGTGWTSPASVDAGHALDSVSCATATLCVAVDDHGNALTFDGTGWSGPTSIDSTNTLEAVSCPTANFCAAVDSVGNALTFPPPIAITTTSLPAGTYHHSYSATLTASGGNPPYKWLAKLPRGLKVDKTTGVISGTPRRSGHFVVTVTLLDQKIRITGRPATQDRAVASLMLTIS